MQNPARKSGVFAFPDESAYNGCMNTKKILGLVAASLLIVLAVIVFLNRDRSVRSLIGLVAAEDIESQGGTIELQGIDDSPIVVPNIRHAAIFSVSVIPEVKVIMVQNISDLQQRLEEDGKDFNTWNSLAQYYQVAGDYAAAREVWEYLGRVFPTNHVAYGNLGFLYGYYLKDAPLAEIKYLKAIENAPEQVFLYFQTAEFYRDVAKSPVKALDIARKGLAKNPGSTELEQLVRTLK